MATSFAGIHFAVVQGLEKPRRAAGRWFKLEPSFPDEGNDLMHLVRDLPASITSAEIRQSSYENLE